MPSLAVQQAFPVPREETQPREKPKLGISTSRKQQQQVAPGPRSAPPGRSKCPRMYTTQSSWAHEDSAVYGKSLARPRRASPNRAEPLGSASRARTDRDSPIIRTRAAAESVYHSSSSPSCQNSTSVSRLYSSNARQLETPPSSPMAHPNDPPNGRGMPDDVPVQHLDAAGVEQVLLRVISQVIASCNSGDHDHLRRMERAQRKRL